MTSDSKSSDSLSNLQIAELLCLEAEEVKQPLQKAMRRAGRKAFLWPQEASSIVEAGESLEQLPGIGPFLAKGIKRWLENPPDVPPPPEIRQNFLTLTQAQSILNSKAAKTWTTATATTMTTTGAIKGDLQMRYGVTAKARSGEWPMPELRVDINTSASPITPKD